MMYEVEDDYKHTFDGVLDPPSAHPSYRPKQAATKRLLHISRLKIRSSPHKQTSVSP